MGTITFNGALTAATLNTGSTSFGVALNGGATVTNAVSFNNTGGVTLGDGAGANDTLLFTGGLTSTASTTTVNGTVRTAAQPLILGAVTLGGSSTLDTTNAGGSTNGEAITVGAVTGAGINLTLNAGTIGLISTGQIGTTGAGKLGTLTLTNSGGATFGGSVDAATVVLTDTAGTIAFLGNTRIATGLTTAANGYSVSFTGSSNTIAGATTFNNTGTLTLGDGGDAIEFTGGLVATAPTTRVLGGATVTALGTGVLDLSGGHSLQVNSDSVVGGSSTGQITLTDAVLLNNSTLTIGTGAAATPISLGAISGAGSTLILNTTGAVTVSGSLGTSGGVLQQLTLTNSGGTTFGGSVDADTVTLTDTTGTIAFQGNTTVNTGLTTANKAYSVSFTGSTNTIAGATTFSNTGTLTLGDGSDAITFASGLTHTAGATHTFGSVLTTNSPIVLAALTLDGDTTFNSGTGATTFGGAVAGSGKNLTLTGGNVWFGSTIEAAALTISASGSVGNQNTRSGGLEQDGAGMAVGRLVFSTTTTPASIRMYGWIGGISRVDTALMVTSPRGPQYTINGCPIGQVCTNIVTGLVNSLNYSADVDKKVLAAEPNRYVDDENTYNMILWNNDLW